MGIRPDCEVLAARLTSPEYSRLVKKGDQFPPGAGVMDFFAFLNAHARRVADKDIAESLGDYLASEATTGLAMRFRAELAKLI